MGKATSNATASAWSEKSVSNTALISFDLPKLIESMKQSIASSETEQNELVLLSSHNKTIVLTALHEGAVINSNLSNATITFQIIEGKVKFHTRNASLILDKGKLLTFDDNAKYKLTSKAETVLLLTIVNAKSNTGGA